MDAEAREPMTAREALFAILCETKGHSVSFEERIASLAEAGLDRREPPNFELTDQLADRLAQAHKLLRELREDAADEGIAKLSGEIDEALVLPPDLEAMVERRIGHG